ncbi:unnamed protein product [Lepidochelys olivacea]
MPGSPAIVSYLRTGVSGKSRHLPRPARAIYPAALPSRRAALLTGELTLLAATAGLAAATMGLCAALGTGRGAGSAPPQPPLSPPPGPACGKRGTGAAASAAPGARLASSCLPSAGGARAELGERGPRCWGTARLCWEGRAAADGAGKRGARLNCSRKLNLKTLSNSQKLHSHKNPIYGTNVYYETTANV